MFCFTYTCRNRMYPVQVHLAMWRMIPSSCEIEPHRFSPLDLFQVCADYTYNVIKQYPMKHKSVRDQYGYLIGIGIQLSCYQISRFGKSSAQPKKKKKYMITYTSSAKFLTLSMLKSLMKSIFCCYSKSPLLLRQQRVRNLCCCTNAENLAFSLRSLFCFCFSPARSHFTNFSVTTDIRRNLCRKVDKGFSAKYVRKPGQKILDYIYYFI